MGHTLHMCIFADASEKRYNTLLDILAEHKVLLDRIVSQNAVAGNIMGIFPINTEEKLKEFNTILETQADPYVSKSFTLLRNEFIKGFKFLLYIL